jgi:hypothetical protein
MLKLFYKSRTQLFILQLTILPGRAIAPEFVARFLTLIVIPAQAHCCPE